MSNLSKFISDLQKGCETCKDFEYNNSGFCLGCYVRLSTIKETLRLVREEIDNTECVNPIHKSFPIPCKEHSKIINADELNQTLKENEEMIK